MEFESDNVFLNLCFIKALSPCLLLGPTSNINIRLGLHYITTMQNDNTNDNTNDNPGSIQFKTFYFPVHIKIIIMVAYSTYY